MPGFKNLTNRKFGKLTVISQALNIGKNVAWNCRCDCGNDKTYRATYLILGRKVCCGCTETYGKGTVKVGEKYNELTVVSRVQGDTWLFLCDCGKTKELRATKVINNKTKSCGCYKKRINKERAKQEALFRKREPMLTSALRIYNSYKTRKKWICDIDFETFLILSQQNCFYCGIEPYRTYNMFKGKKKSLNSSVKSINEGGFTYNGLDRIDSLQGHLLNNVVPACFTCNKGKNNRISEDFISSISNIVPKIFTPINILKLNLPKFEPLIRSIKYAYRNYKDLDISIEEFHYLSQLNCYYCDGELSNNFNSTKIKKQPELLDIKANFNYNGLDRVDNINGHQQNNIVPCCKYCNFVKGNMKLNEFYEWIERFKKYQEEQLILECYDVVSYTGIDFCM